MTRKWQVALAGATVLAGAACTELSTAPGDRFFSSSTLGHAPAPARPPHLLVIG